MAQDKAVNIDKYNGPSKMWHAEVMSSYWGAYGLLGGIAGSLMYVGSRAKGMIKDLNGAIKSGADVSNIQVDPKQIKSMSRNFWLILAVPTIVTSIMGAIHGWRKAGQMESQHDDLVAQKNEARSEVQRLQTQVEGLNREVEASRHGFAERHAKKEHASHAEKVGGHHGEHGSHADAARASQHEAEHAQHAM